MQKKSYKGYPVSVTQRINDIIKLHPRGGLLNPKLFEVSDFEDGNKLNEIENVR